MAQEQIAVVVSRAVVDRFEAIEVNQEQRERGIVALAHPQGLLHPVAQQSAVRQLREGIVNRLMPQGVLGPDAFGHVGAHPDRARYPARVVGQGQVANLNH